MSERATVGPSVSRLVGQPIGLTVTQFFEKKRGGHCLRYVQIYPHNSLTGAQNH